MSGKSIQEIVLGGLKTVRDHVDDLEKRLAEKDARLEERITALEKRVAGLGGERALPPWPKARRSA